MMLGSAIGIVTTRRGEERLFCVRIPQDGSPQYIFDDDPEVPVDVPTDIVAEAEVMVAENPE